MQEHKKSPCQEHLLLVPKQSKALKEKKVFNSTRTPEAGGMLEHFLLHGVFFKEMGPMQGNAKHSCTLLNVINFSRFRRVLTLLRIALVVP